VRTAADVAVELMVMTMMLMMSLLVAVATLLQSWPL